MSENIEKQLVTREYMELKRELLENCFICGTKNTIGAKIQFKRTGDNEVLANYIPPKTWAGWGKIVHGGLQAALLDEAAGWATILLLNGYALTIKAEVVYLCPIYIEEQLTITARIFEHEGSKVVIKAELKQDGKVCTKGTITYKIVAQEKIEKIALKD